MIKKTILLTLLLFLIAVFPSFAKQQEIKIRTEISHVDIYPDSAVITRKGETGLLSAGNYRLIFNNIIEDFIDGSLHAGISKNIKDRATINGVNIETVFVLDEPEEKVRQLREEINLLEKEVNRLKSIKKSLNDKKVFLDSIINNDYQEKENPDEKISITSFPSTEKLTSVYTFLSEKLGEYYDEIYKLDLQLEYHMEQIDFLNKQLQQIAERQRDSKKMVSVDLEIIQESVLNIFLAYQVNKGISWNPVYDIRANVNDKEGDINIVSYAMIKQNTGVDWENIDISLSTAKPSISGKLPDIEPWYLQIYQSENKISKSLEMPVLDYEQVNIAGTRDDKTALSVPIEQKGTSVTFVIPQKITISSGTSQGKVMIYEDTIKGQYNYKTCPQLSPYAYFNIYVNNNLELPLLPGKVNVYLDGTFTGNTFLDFISPGEDFDVSLGVAENVKVKRKLIKKFRDETLISTIPSSKIVTKYEYNIAVENFQNIEIYVDLFEIIPVPEDDRIQVNIEKVSIAPNIREWNNKIGVWMWRFPLKPKEKNEINFIYSIVHPRDMKIINMP